MTAVRAKKALGQHFLVDLNIARKICDALSGGPVFGTSAAADSSARPGDVLEVGCGMGVLTQFLLRREDLVTWGAEIDTESVAYLHAHYPDFTPRLIEGDFLKLDLRAHFRRDSGSSAISPTTSPRRSSSGCLKTATSSPNAWE